MKRACLFMMLTFISSGICFAEDNEIPTRVINGFNVAELIDEEADAKKQPFVISQITQNPKSLYVWITVKYGGVGNTANNIKRSVYEAYLSDSDGNSSPVSMEFMKSVSCNSKTGDNPHNVSSKYVDTLPASCEVVESTKYYLSFPVYLRSGLELGIGQDPDYIWMIEKL